jgi:hypothetical protein
VEDVEDADFGRLEVLARPSGVRITNGWAHVDPAVGIGVELAEEDT